MHLVHSFPPIAAPDARVLLLGSMPGVASLAAGQYYAHPRNAFWPILGTLLGFDPAAPYALRTQALRTAGIALWDVLQACERDGSADADIREASQVPNEFRAFLGKHPSIRDVFFNGTTAERIFRKLVLPTLGATSLRFTRLPSTSPAHAGLTFDRKLAAWRTVVDAPRSGVQ